VSRSSIPAAGGGSVTQERARISAAARSSEIANDKPDMSSSAFQQADGEPDYGLALSIFTRDLNAAMKAV
jgi:hypothetical protein